MRKPFARMNDPASQREKMVHQQLVRRGIHNAAVLHAMSEVPRELFIPEAYRRHAYADAALPIEEGQTISQPYIVALMMQLLEPLPGDRALEVGTGSGYAAAVLSRMVQEVYTLERYATLAHSAAGLLMRLGFHNVHVVNVDGSLGWPDHAPYQVIVISAGAPEIPRALLAQLAVAGRLVAPVGASPYAQELVRVRRTGEQDYRREIKGLVQFVPLVGEDGWPESTARENKTR